MDSKTVTIIVVGFIILATLAWFTLMGKQFSQPSGLLGLVESSSHGTFSDWNNVPLNNTASNGTGQNQTYSAISKTLANDTDKDMVCERPYVKIGSYCCLDSNGNGFCDSGEFTVPPHHKSSCSSPYSMVNGACCVDQNGNNICDANETITPLNTPCNDSQVNSDSGGCCPDLNNDSICDSEPACLSPYTIIGGVCCVDFNSNGMCDETETPNLAPGSCEKPLEMIGGVCCLDIIDDGICDNETSAISFFDVHAHVSSDIPLGQVVSMMDKSHVKKMVLMEPPATSSQDASSDYWIPDAAEQYPDNFIVLYGGEAKAMLEANAGSEPSEEDTKAFSDLLESAMGSGKYRGFGEIGLRHFGHGSGDEGYDLTIPGNHPWMLIMSDIAAKFNVPIDVHMEVTNDSVAGLDELLYHNENAKIIWDHAGWSNTGMPTAKMMGMMMGKHQNLYASIKLRKPKTQEMTAVSIMDENGTISKAWLQLFNDYPDRFMIGTDVKIGFGSNDNASEMFEMHEKLLEQLPPDIVKKIGTENAVAVFGTR